MNKHTKLTLQELIARKAQILEEKQKGKKVTLYVQSLDATIVVERPEKELVVEASEMDGAEGDAYVVFNCVVEPNLKDAKLQEEFGCVEPREIVSKVFAEGEISLIAKTIIDMLGYSNKVEVVQDVIKN